MNWHFISGRARTAIRQLDSRVWPGSGSDPALGAPLEKGHSGKGEEVEHQGRLEGVREIGWMEEGKGPVG